MDNRQEKDIVLIAFTESEIKSNIVSIESKIETLQEIINNLKVPNFNHPAGALLNSMLNSTSGPGKKMIGYMEEQIINLTAVKIKLMQGSLDLKKQTRQAAQS